MLNILFPTDTDSDMYARLWSGRCNFAST